MDALVALTLRWELRPGAREAQLRVTRWRGGATLPGEPGISARRTR